MWKSISLSYLEFNDLKQTIHDFINDIDKLRHLQATSHTPLILSLKKESKFQVIFAKETLEVLSKVEAQFVKFKDKASTVTMDIHTLESHDLLMGNKETFKNKLAANIEKQKEALTLV